MTRAAPVLLLAAGQFLAMADRWLFAVAAPGAKAALGLSDGAIGFALGTAYALGYGLAALPLGRWSDAGARRALIVGGLLVCTAGSLATGLAAGAASLIAARAVLALGHAAFAPAAVAVLASGPEEARAGRLAAFTAGSTLGRSVALLGGGAILTLLAPGGWRWLFVLTALPNLLVAALLAGRVPGGALVERRVPLRLPPALMLYLIGAVAPLVAGQAASAWAPSVLVRALGWPAGRAGLLAGAVTLVAAPASAAMGGVLGRRWRLMRERPATVIAAAVAAALPGFAALAWAHDALGAGVALGWINLALGVGSFAGLFGWQALTPAGVRGTANGLFMGLTVLVGAGVGPLLTGVLSDAGSGLGRALAWTALAAAALAAGAAALGRRSIKPGPATA